MSHPPAPNVTATVALLPSLEPFGLVPRPLQYRGTARCARSRPLGSFPGNSRAGVARSLARRASPMSVHQTSVEPEKDCNRGRRREESPAKTQVGSFLPVRANSTADARETRATGASPRSRPQLRAALGDRTLVHVSRLRTTMAMFRRVLVMNNVILLLGFYPRSPGLRSTAASSHRDATARMDWSSPTVQVEHLAHDLGRSRAAT